MSKLVLIRGLPGSGKSTKAKEYIPNGFIHLESDEWHFNHLGQYIFETANSKKSHIWVELNTENFIRKGKDVVVSNVFIKMPSIVPYYNIALRYKYDFEVISLPKRFTDIHNVPELTLKQMSDAFEEYSLEKIIALNYYDINNLDYDLCETKE